MKYYVTQAGREFIEEAGVGKTMRAAIGSGEQQTATQPGKGGPLAKRAKLAKKMQAFKPRLGGQGVPAEDNPAFGRATSRPETVPGRRAARREVARTAGQPEEVRRAAGHAAMGRG